MHPNGVAIEQPGFAQPPILGMVLAADYTLTSTTSAQKLFDATTNGAVTLPAGMYYFKCGLYLTGMSGSTGNLRFDLLGTGTATIDRIFYQGTGLDNTSPLTTNALSGGGSVTSGSTASIFTAGAGTGARGFIEGWFLVSVGGTIIPSGALVTAATPAVKAGSGILFWPLWASSKTYAGTWT